MPTPAYLIAQQIIPLVKARCPRIVVPVCKNSFTFFAGTAYEQTVQFRRMMAHADPFWEPSDHEPTMRDWRTRINAGWLSTSYNKILLDEIYSVMGIPEGTCRHSLEDDLPEIMGRTLQIAKARVWGIPVNLRSEAWFFHRLITGCAKKTVQEAVWKFACTNTGNVYNLNENVMMDAILEQKAYQSLYAIHPLLGRSWVPWVRRFVEQTTEYQAEFPCYAKQLQSALGALGVRKSGMKTLHRMAETSPMTFRSSMRHLVRVNENGNAEELVAMLNLLNGQKPALGVAFKRIIGKVTNGYQEIPARHPEDIRVMARIDQWLAKDMRFDRGLIFDWMRFAASERRGSLHRGYMDVTDGIENPAKRKEAALAWANRSQQYWHRHRPPARADDIFQVEQVEQRSLAWKPLLDDRVFYLDGGWTFVELTSSADLREEGDAMQHCVAGYDRDCHRGQSHIFSVRKEKQRGFASGTGFRPARISTLELRHSHPARAANGRAKRYVIAQHRGPQNAAISTACRKAAEQFLTAISVSKKVRVIA